MHTFLAIGLFAHLSFACNLTAIEKAVMVDALSRVQSLSSGCFGKMNDRLSFGHTLLHRAAQYDAVDSAKWLLAQKVESSHVTTDSETPLHFARSIEMAKLLIADGVQIAAQDRWERTAFFKMLELKNWKLLNFMRKKGAVIRVADLQWAADFYHTDVLDYLADHVTRQSIRDQGTFFRTFFFYDDEYQDIAAKLVEKGANVDAARSLSTQRRPLEVYIDEYVTNQMGYKKHGLKAIRFLLKMGANVNAFSKDSGRPLFHYFLLKGDYKTNSTLLNLFLKHGLDIDLRNNFLFGKTALMDLASGGFSADEKRKVYELKMMKRLLKKGANPNAQSDEGRTALHYAVRWSNPVATNFLVTKTDLSLKDSNGRTALKFAYERLSRAPSVDEKRKIVKIIKILEGR